MKGSVPLEYLNSRIELLLMDLHKNRSHKPVKIKLYKMNNYHPLARGVGGGEEAMEIIFDALEIFFPRKKNDLSESVRGWLRFL